MLRTYGQGMIDRLKEKQQMIVTFREGDFNEIAKHYKEEFERIEQMRKDGHVGIIDLIAY
jgi:hypothetical protein